MMPASGVEAPFIPRKEMTKKFRIGFQGTAGAHSDVAIKQFFTSINQPSSPTHPVFQKSSNDSFESLPFDSLKSLLQFTDWDYAFVPIENTDSGTFTQIYDLLLQHHNRVFIIGEFQTHEENCLLVNNDIKDLREIETVYSHPHVLEQCSDIIDLIKKECPKLTVHGTEDTADAAAMLRDRKLKNAAVIASPAAAKMYNLQILKGQVENDVKSCTRYLILSNKPLSNDQLSFSAQMVSNKTSIAVALKNSSGMLFKALSCFALRDINVTKIESRPSHRAYSSLTSSQSPWEYINYVDVDGGISEDRIRNALESLKEFSTELKVFGSYPRFGGQVGSVAMSYGI